MPTAPWTTLVGRLRTLAATEPEAEVTDREYLDRYVRHQDEAAFAALVRRHGRLVWNVCRCVLPHHHDAEDAFQATFLVLARKAGALPAAAGVAGWLHGAAYRSALELKRKAARRRRHESRVVPPGAAPPAGDLAWRELQAILNEELQGLPDKYRAPFVLCCLEGYSKAEAARALGWPEGSVSGRLAHARRVLRARLARRGIALSAVLCGVAVATRPAEALAPALVGDTTRAALSWAGIRVGTSMHDGRAALAETVTRALFPGRMPRIAGLLLALTIACAGAGLLAFPSREPPVPPVAASPPPAPRAAPVERPRADRYGDPLPAGVLARLGTTRLQHGFITYTVSFSPDGKTIASGGAGRGLVLWDAATGKERRVLVPVQGVGALAFSPDGKRIAAAYEIKIIHVWDVATGRAVATLPGSEGGVPQALAFSPDGKTLASGGYDALVRLIDLATGREVRVLKGHEEGVKALAFAPDGKTLVSGGLDGRVCLWDPATGEQRARLAGHSRYVLWLAFTRDGRTLASAAEKEGVRLWDVAARRQVRFIEAKDSWRAACALSGDGRTLATGHKDGTVRVWDTATGREARHWQAHAMSVFALAFSPDSQVLASGGMGDSSIRLWRPTTAKELLPSGGPHGYLSLLAFADGGKTLRVAARDRVFRRWDWAADAEKIEQTFPSAAWWLQAFSPDGRAMATLNFRDKEVLLTTADTRPPRRLRGHEDSIGAVAFSADGKILASGDAKGSVRLWDVASGRETLRFAAGQEVSALTFSPDGKVLASGAGGQFGGRPVSPAVCLWDLAAGREMRALDLDEAVYGLDFSPNGRWLASLKDPRDNGFRLWDVRTGKPVVLAPVAQVCHTVTFSPDSRWLAWGSGERESAIRVVEMATGREALCLRGGHHTGVVRLSFAPDGQLLASGGGDSTVLVWDLSGQYRSGRLVPAKRSPAEMKALWADLAEDSARAFRAVEALAATTPDDVVPFLKERLRPEPAAEPRQVATWIRRLDSANFKAREEGRRQLEKQGLAARAALRQALAAAPSPEVQRRLKDLLEKLEPSQSPALLRVLRVLSVLEMIGTPEARQVLEGLVRYGAGGWLEEEARGALAGVRG
ncbi:MAG: sigma-70 family RNA polymerase sigma factor [Planctomycetes bacterium]|nr:sigma-70 family RNA polymerase sigma factor [Planctomycetota bacterium]